MKILSRTKNGMLGTMLLRAVIIIVIGLGALAVDIGHIQTVQGELQNATDAAALAGARDYVNGNEASADSDALAVAARNTADGKAVSPTTPHANVTVTASPPVAGEGSVEVNAQIQITDLLAPIFGRKTETISARSQANYYPSVSGIFPNQMFPIAPSLDDTSHGAALQTKNVGDAVNITIQPSGGNAAWTSGTTTHPSTTVIRQALDIALGLASPDSSENPAMTADGTNEIALTQGLHNGVDLTGSKYASVIEQMPYVVLPCILGSNPYNKSRTLEGFICVKVNSMSTGPDSLTLNCTLVKGLVRGSIGSLPTGGVPTTLSAGTIKLVQAQ